MGLFQKKSKSSSAREQSSKISSDESEPKHIGKHTAETITQEIYSIQNTKPAFRDQKWMKRFDSILEAIGKKLSRNENSVMCQTWLRNMELIRNQR